MNDREFMIMVEQAERALRHVVEAEKNDDVKLITDRECEEIALAFHEACKRLGLCSELITLPGKRPLKDVPNYLIEKINNPDICINAFKSSAEETPFRVKLIDIEIKKGAKVAHAPGITKDMFIEGALHVDYGEMWENARMLMEILDNAETLRVTTRNGTDLVLKIGGRKFQTDIKIKRREIGNLPAGEIWCAPHEDGADGVAVIDGTIGDLGFVPSPVKLHISRGKVVKIECDDEDFRKRLEELLNADEMAPVIGELGMGLNPGAKLVGNMLVDEKAARTIHIAFGNNMDFHGGKNNSSMHRDFLIKEPDVEVIYADGKRKTIMKDGIILS